MQKIGQNFNEMEENENFIGWQHCIRPCFSLPQLLFVLLLSLHTNLGIVLNFVLIEDRESSWGKKQNFECIFLKTRVFNFQTLKCRISTIFRARKLNEVSLEREFSPLYYYLGNCLFGKLTIQEIDYLEN